MHVRREGITVMAVEKNVPAAFANNFRGAKSQHVDLINVGNVNLY